MKEADFESHVAECLSTTGWKKVEAGAPNSDYIDGASLSTYIRALQKKEPVLQRIPENELLGTVLEAIRTKWKNGEETAVVLKNGVRLIELAFTVNLLDAHTPGNNIFSFQTQYQHDSSNQERKIDLMLWVNGIPLAPIELKNQQTGQSARDGMEQLIHRSTTDQCPNLFKHAVFSAAVDTNKVLLSLNHSPKTEKDFRNFDPTAETYEAPEGEFNTQHFYRDFLSPCNVVELLYDFIYEEVRGAKKSLIFPRFHQWEAVRYLCREIQECSKEKHLGQRYLLQHSPGSGKSKTIAWLCRQFKSLFIPGTKETVFDKVIVVTDRRDLDAQLQRDLEPLLGKHVVTQAESKSHLAELIAAANCTVVTSTVQKFLDLDQGAWPRDKKIAIIIDEAHRSQEGEYNEDMRKTLEAKPALPEDSVYLGDAISDSIKGQNTVVVALTATPTDSTLARFGKNRKPHHLYSMSQAIDEGYIINVVKNVVTYDTLYMLHQSGANIPFLTSYPPSFLNRTLTWAAYESENIIEEKARIISAMIRSRTINAINGKGRAMLTCISRKAAALYQEKLKDLLKDYDIAPLVAYTDGGDLEKIQKLNEGVGAMARTDEELKTIFREEDKYRILVVASKFQTGFDETLLHTLFLDKPVKGINAVQTLSRLNRTHPGKEDTLIVDFTNSFVEISKAFGMFLGQSEALSEQTFNFNDLKEAFSLLMKATDTKEEDWFPQVTGSELDHTSLDKICSAISKKAAGHKASVITVYDMIKGLTEKGTVCDSVEWATKREVLKGVIGYLSKSTGKYSSDSLKASVSAIGLATKLINLGERAIPLEGSKTGEGGGGAAPKEVTMADAIARINQENVLKLQKYINTVKTSIEETRRSCPAELWGAIEVYEKENEPHIRAYSGADDLVDLIEGMNPDSHREVMFAVISNGLQRENLEKIVSLIQAKTQLAEIECKFYNTQSRIREELVAAQEASVGVQRGLEKLSTKWQPKETNGSSTS